MDEMHHLRFGELFRLSLRVFRQKPMRTFLTVLGMAVGIATVLFLVSLGYGLQYILIGRLVTTEDSLITMEAYYPSEANLSINERVIEELAKEEDIAEVSPVAEFSAELSGKNSSTTIVSIGARVVDENYYRLTGLSPDIGVPPSGNNKTAIITGQTASLINLATSTQSIGEEILLKVFYQNDFDGTSEEIRPKSEVKIGGIISDESEPPLIIIFSSMLEKSPTNFNSVLVKAKSAEVLEKLKDNLIEKGFIVSARIDLVNQAKKILNIITITLGVFGITALIVSAIGMFNTMIVGFLERIYEIGILKSIGATDSDIKKLFLMESSIMGLTGGLSGIIIGYSLGQTANFVLSFIAQRLGGKPFDLFITPAWFIILIVFLSILIGFISGYWPARKAAGLSPKEAFINK